MIRIQVLPRSGPKRAYCRLVRRPSARSRLGAETIRLTQANLINSAPTARVEMIICRADPPLSSVEGDFVGVPAAEHGVSVRRVGPTWLP